MYFKPYYLGCLAHASYLIGGTNGEAAVIDPRRDVEEYLADADAAGLRIAHVIETHLHADFVSGHVELARRAGATIHMGAGSGARFAHRPVRDDDTISLGDVTLRFLQTPGHTPESVTIVAEGQGAPGRAFTGDTLFIGDVGRPDLVGSKGFTAEEMARKLFASLRDKILPLPDTMEVWPAHGAGSACGKSLSDERVSTIGRQKRENIALGYVVHGDEEGFVRYATEGLADAPAYFAFDAQKNREGGASVEEVLASARALSPGEVEELSEDDTLILDTRSVAAFGTGHVPGALHVQLEGKFAPWVGAIIPPDAPMVIVAEPEHQTEAITRLARIGYENITGWLDGGMDAWMRAGGEVVALPQMPAAELAQPEPDNGQKPRVLDVRTNDEWQAGHLPGALHIPLSELPNRLGELPDAPLIVLCGSGYRSSIAASLLQRAGRGNVVNAAGGWEAFQAAK